MQDDWSLLRCDWPGARWRVALFFLAPPMPPLLHLAWRVSCSAAAVSRAVLLTSLLIICSFLLEGEAFAVVCARNVRPVYLCGVEGCLRCQWCGKIRHYVDVSFVCGVIYSEYLKTSDVYDPFVC